MFSSLPPWVYALQVTRWATAGLSIERHQPPKRCPTPTRERSAASQRGQSSQLLAFPRLGKEKLQSTGLYSHIPTSLAQLAGPRRGGRPSARERPDGRGRGGSAGPATRLSCLGRGSEGTGRLAQAEPRLSLPPRGLGTAPRRPGRQGGPSACLPAPRTLKKFLEGVTPPCPWSRIWGYPDLEDDDD